MTGSRQVVLDRIRTALAADDRAPVTVHRSYNRTCSLPPGSEQAIELLIDRLIDYKALVRRADPDNLSAVINEALETTESVVIPHGLPAEVADACARDGRTVTIDGEGVALTPGALDTIDVVVTAARVAIALSGTIILDAEADQGRRAITLIPDRHLVILHAGQVVETVAEAIALLEPSRPLTMIAGPSATSDIELERVEGVHGPRILEVIIVGQ